MNVWFVRNAVESSSVNNLELNLGGVSYEEKHPYEIPFEIF
ncbi:hypothetical protein [Methanosarcina sp. UBA289]|nr:hypothetical protein [Methanosarcina sp. UBA289]